jgi:3-methyladenine DNA glycosylase AlkD
MTFDEIMQELASKGTAQTKKTLMRHGAPEPLFGVKVGDLKPLAKKLKGCQDLALELYATKNSDAMYLAGLIADGSKMTKKQLDQWASGATWHMISGCTVPWVASEHPQAISVAKKWIDSKKELIATSGWATLAAVVGMIDDDALPIDELSELVERVEKQVHSAPNRVRYAMNNFIICVGTYVLPLAAKALASAKKIGVVDVDMGDTACQVPEAAPYIVKCRNGQKVAPKRKTMRC